MSVAAFSRSWIALALALVLVSAARTLPAQAGKQEESVKRLKSVGVYAFGGVGFAGVISKGELDYRAILLQPRDQALKLFEDVFAQGNNQGKSYALKGIYQLDPDRFKELSEGVAKSDDVVLTMSGCVIQSSKLKEVVKGITAGSAKQPPPS